MTVGRDDRGGVSTNFFFKEQLVSLGIEDRDPLEVKTVAVVEIAEVTSGSGV